MIDAARLAIVLAMATGFLLAWQAACCAASRKRGLAQIFVGAAMFFGGAVALKLL